MRGDTALLRLRELFVRHRRAFVMSVSEFGHTPFAAMKIAADGTLQPHFPEYLGRMAEVKSNGSAPITPREP